MFGIASYSVHLPSYRLTAKTVNTAWGRHGGGGTKAVANHDENALTLAHQAAAPIADRQTEAFVFASTTAPLAEKSSAAFLAVALDLPPTVITRDLSGSLRAATGALLDAMNGDRSTLLAAADLRIGEPGSITETTFGDAGAALMIGPESETIARHLASATVSVDMTDLWRSPADRYVRADDARFAAEEYRKIITPAIADCLEQAGLAASEIAQVAITAPNPKSAAAVARSLGFDRRTQLVHDPAALVGLTGAAHPLLLLAALLEGAAPGDRLLLASYGDGADVILFEATDRIADYRSPAPLKQTLSNGREMTGYAQYLAFRQLIVGQRDNENIFASSIQRRREGEPLYRLRAQRCDHCERVDTLNLPTCPQCGNTEHFSEQKLSRRGIVFTHTTEYYYPSPAGPTGIWVIDLDGGGRITVQATDTDGTVAIGDTVELTLRRLHRGGGIDNYFWKCRPIP